jgi:carbon storage regulator
MKTGNLVLTRKTGQKVMIGNEIIAEVLNSDSREVKLLFSVPKNIEVHREEVYHRIHHEGTQQEKNKINAERGSLVLSRKIGQRVMIGDEIIVEVLNSDSKEVRLLFSVPESIEVHREEVYHRIHHETNEQM